MYARLGFAVAISVEPEILIVDEILSVGDIFFQQKCFTKMREIIQKGVTFIFVTHDTTAMQNICDRTLLLDAGKVEYIGNVNEAVNRYHAKMSRRVSKNTDGVKNNNDTLQNEKIFSSPQEIIKHSIPLHNGGRHGLKGLEIVAARVIDETGKDTLHIQILGSIFLNLLLRANENITEPYVGIHLYDRLGNLVFAAGTPQLRYTLPSLHTGEEIVVRFELTMSVAPGEYTFSLLSAEPSKEGGPNTGYFHDVINMLGPIHVIGNPAEVFPFYGIAQLPMKINNGKPFYPLSK